jgi:hypothetical protein
MADVDLVAAAVALPAREDHLAGVRREDRRARVRRDVDRVVARVEVLADIAAGHGPAERAAERAARATRRVPATAATAATAAVGLRLARDGLLRRDRFGLGRRLRR